MASLTYPPPANTKYEADDTCAFRPRLAPGPAVGGGGCRPARPVFYECRPSRPRAPLAGARDRGARARRPRLSCVRCVATKSRHNVAVPYDTCVGSNTCTGVNAWPSARERASRHDKLSRICTHARDGQGDLGTEGKPPAARDRPGAMNAHGRATGGRDRKTQTEQQQGGWAS